MAIFRGIGGSGEANDSGTLDSVTEQAQAAASSATDASNSATAAANSASAAATSATNAAASESSVEADATAAASSASSAASSATSAASSATSAASSATTATTAVADIDTSVTAAETAQAAAEAAQTAAETAETNAETAETNAASSASSASTSASNASTSATAAAGSATTAASEASDAATSATAAASSATSAASSATTATTKASEAATSATNAAASETAAAASETAAAASESAAAASESAAATSETNAATSASNASTSETNAAASASSASTSATNAATSETNAASSASSAASAQSAAEAARDSALAAYDSFDDRYLGVKTSDPSLDNDGNALVSGALYFNSTDEKMRLYTGSSWVDAYTTGAGFLQISSNLSDLNNAATARTNLGLGTAATTASTDYATAAQGTLADSATQPGDNVSTLTNDSGYITGNQTITLSGDVSGSGTTSIAVTVADDSHNHIISNVDGLQTALDGKMDKTANLGDITSSSTARSNLGLGTAAISPAEAFVAVSGDNMTGNLSFGDNNKAQFGASDDLQIYHTGTESFIEDKGTGNLNLSSNGAGTVITGIGGKTAEFFTGGAVNLYYNGGTYTDPKLSTTSTGIDVTGTVDTDRIVSSGTSGATSLKGHSGTTTTISGTTVETNTSFVGSNSVGNLSIWVDTTTSDLYLGSAYTGGDVNLVRRQSPNNYKALNIDGATGDIAFYEDQGITQKLIWDASAETLTFKDNVNANFGSNNDLQIDHTGTDSRIVNTAGHLILRNTTADKDIYLQADDGAGSYATYLLADGSTGGLKLYHNSSGTYKLVTTSTGIDVIGDIDMNESGSDSYLRQDGDIVVGRSDSSNFVRLGSSSATDFLRFFSGGSERMRISSSGNVGIGTSSPSSYQNHRYLDLVGASTTQGGVFQTKTSDGATGAYFYTINGLVNLGSSTNDPFRIVTNGSERMRIDTSGNLLVGTTNATQYTLGSGGDAGLCYRANASLDVARQQNVVSILNRLGTDGVILEFRKDGVVAGNIGVTGASITFGRGDTALACNADLDAVYPITAGGSARDNAIDLGRSAVRYKDLYLSGDMYVNAGYGSSAKAYGCRAWVNFNGTGTVAIRTGGNVSSITDHTTGQYTVNFTTAMPDTNYVMAGTVPTYLAPSNFTNGTVCYYGAYNTGASSKATTSVRIVTANVNASTALDYAEINVAIFR